jgi:hypothetical protein
MRQPPVWIFCLCTTISGGLETALCQAKFRLSQTAISFGKGQLSGESWVSAKVIAPEKFGKS